MGRWKNSLRAECIFVQEKLAEARSHMAEKKGSEEELIRSLEIPANIPLYVSIDKDVLCPEEAATTWSRGYDFRRDAESTSGIVLSF